MSAISGPETAPEAEPGRGGGRGRGLDGTLQARMAWAVTERRTTATTRRVPPQLGQVRTSVWNVRLRSSATGDGAAAPAGTDGLGRHRARSCLGRRRRSSRRRHDEGPDPGVGSDDAEVADEVGPGRRDERGEAAKEGHRGEEEVRLPGFRGGSVLVGEGKYAAPIYAMVQYGLWP